MCCYSRISAVSGDSPAPETVGTAVRQCTLLERSGAGKTNRRELTCIASPSLARRYSGCGSLFLRPRPRCSLLPADVAAAARPGAGQWEQGTGQWEQGTGQWEPGSVLPLSSLPSPAPPLLGLSSCRRQVPTGAALSSAWHHAVGQGTLSTVGPVFRRCFSQAAGAKEESSEVFGKECEWNLCPRVWELRSEGPAGAVLLQFWRWDWKLGPSWDALLPRQLWPFSKFGWESEKGKILCILIKCLLWARRPHLAEKCTLLSHLNPSGRDGCSRRKRRLEEHCRFWKVLVVLLPGQRGRVKDWEARWVWSQLTVTVEGL